MKNQLLRHQNFSIFVSLLSWLAPYFRYLDSIEAHNGKTFITVSVMNSLKDTKLTLAMNCHRIVILYNEKMNNERTDTKFCRLVIFL